MLFFSRYEQIVLVIVLAALLAGGGALLYARGRHAGDETPGPFLIEPTTPVATTLLVHVAGQVHRPGVYRVPAETRVVEAIKAAGGALPDADLDALNLAGKVQDGEKIEVLSKQETAAAQVPARPGATTAPVYPEKRPFTGKVSINTASAAALQQLSGIGPGYAQRIIDYRARLRREEGRGFASIEELMNVPGIGPKRFSEIRDHVTL